MANDDGRLTQSAHPDRSTGPGGPKTAEKTPPYVAVLIEPRVADWHVIEMVALDFGPSAADDIGFNFPEPPTVAEAGPPRPARGRNSGNAQGLLDTKLVLRM